MESDSDSDSDCFFPVPKGLGVIEEVNFDTILRNNINNLEVDAIGHLFELLLCRDYEKLSRFSMQLHQNAYINNEHSVKLNELSKSVEKLVNGDYIDILSACVQISYAKLTTDLTISSVREAIVRYILMTNCYADIQFRILECVVIGVAYLELFCQMNYTGPELPYCDVSKFKLPGNDNNNSNTSEDIRMSLFHSLCTSMLEVDGEYPFPLVDIPVTLLLSRIILSTLSSFDYAYWNQSIIINMNASDNSMNKQISYTRVKLSPSVPDDIVDRELLTSLSIVLELFHAPISWFSSRAAITHLRLIMHASCSSGNASIQDRLPTLWNEVQGHFTSTLFVYGNLLGNSYEYVIDEQPSKSYLDKSGDNAQKLVPFRALDWLGGHYSPEECLFMKTIVEAQVWMEFGLMHYYFLADKCGKQYFAYAKNSTGLKAELTGVMGKNTKYQVEDFAQLFLDIQSNLTNLEQSSGPAAASITATTGTEDVAVIASNPIKDELKDNANLGSESVMTFETGRKILTESKTGEEVSVREVFLDSVSQGGVGGYDDNIYFEGGVKYTNNEHMREVPIHHLDEAIILALCLIVANSNVTDALTHSEMLSYIQAILNYYHANLDKKKNKLLDNTQLPNWMIYSTALLQRSWIEYEKRRTADRAMLQIQALIDQHTTKLTMMQSTREAAVEQSAPVKDRMKYLFAIVYPAQYELKADIAQRYLQSGVTSSALAYFKELQMWDEVVTCYQLLEKPHRAEVVVRERLAVEGGKTPYMLTSLGDLTRKMEYYEEAWELSGHRYARAQRTMGRVRFDQGNYPEAIKHFGLALHIQPVNPNLWYMKGIACMRIEKMDDAVEAFVRCIQQQSKDSEFAEAFANLGAIYMRKSMYAQAYASFLDAYRLSRDNWKIVENLMLTALVLGKYMDCLQYMMILVDKRHVSHRAVHVDELRRVAYMVSHHQRREWDAIHETTVRNAEKAYTQECKLLLKVFTHVTSNVKSNAFVWDIYAETMEVLGEYNDSKEYRMKELRALLVEYSESYQSKGNNSTRQEFYNRIWTSVHALVLLYQAHAGDISSNTADSKSLIKSMMLKIRPDRVLPMSGADNAVPSDVARQVRFADATDVIEPVSAVPAVSFNGAEAVDDLISKLQVELDLL